LIKLTLNLFTVEKIAINEEDLHFIEGFDTILFFE